MTKHMKNDFSAGLSDGIPIALGYFSVSFGVGILAVQNGLPAWAAAVISVTNLTSAGEAAGIGVIGAAGSYLEMVLTQLLINCRYFLMALSLSQNLAPGFHFPQRLIAAYGITDEIFGVASSKKEPLTPRYLYGLILLPTVGWTLGTYLGAVCGELVPERISNALGILLYGMFLAIIIPPIKHSRENLAVLLIAAFISCVLYYLLPQVSSGFAIIISAVITSLLMAFAAPISIEEEEKE